MKTWTVLFLTKANDLVQLDYLFCGRWLEQSSVFDDMVLIGALLQQHSNGGWETWFLLQLLSFYDFLRSITWLCP